MDYTPPEDDGFEPEVLKEVEIPDQTASFEFDPDRSDKELALLNVGPAVDPQSGPVKYGSYSTVSVFNECPKRVELRKVEGKKEPSGPAADRGNMIHDQAEHYVDGTSDSLPEAKKVEFFQNRFNFLRDEYLKGNVELEQNWGFDSDWNVVKDDGKIFKNPLLWYIAKLDVFLWESQTSAVVIDHKSGRKFGNEMKHGQQALTYVLAAFMRYPQLEFVRSEFWYLDQGEDLIKSYTRAEAMVMLTRITDKILKLTTCTYFPPKPSARNCKWCHFATTGDCEYAFEAL